MRPLRVLLRASVVKTLREKRAEFRTLISPTVLVDREEQTLHFKPSEDPMADRDLIEEIRFLLEHGQKIEAIKLFRERTGLGLKEAKDAVEAIERDEYSPEQWERDSSAVELDVVSLLEQGRKIEAIKRYREQTGAGLKEAKEAVEAIAAERGISSSGGGCLGMILLLCLLAVVGVAI